jgi:hypothetical protein
MALSSSTVIFAGWDFWTGPLTRRISYIRFGSVGQLTTVVARPGTALRVEEVAESSPCDAGEPRGPSSQAPRLFSASVKLTTVVARPGTANRTATCGYYCQSYSDGIAWPRKGRIGLCEPGKEITRILRVLH